MSRKDPRRRLMVPLTATQRHALREAVQRTGRRGSLADRLRQILVAELARGVADHGAVIAEGSGLPLQLPRPLRRQVEGLATVWGSSPAYVVQQALTQYLMDQTET